MPYGKTQDFNNPTVQDFEEKASPQEKKLWETYLKDYPQPFQRSIMAVSDNFLFVCPSANLVVELEKFRRFSDSAGGVSGKKGDALREMGLKLAAYTYRELDTDFEGVCNAIDRAVNRQMAQESLVEIRLVEIPCIKRNASGVAGAFVAAELALAGIASAIPADEVILAMKQVGDAIPVSLRETSEGGLATTPTGKRLFEQVFGETGGGSCSGCGRCK